MHRTYFIHVAPSNRGFTCAAYRAGKLVTLASAASPALAVRDAVRSVRQARKCGGLRRG